MCRLPHGGWLSHRTRLYVTSAADASAGGGAAGDGVFTTLGSKPNQVGANWYDNIWIDRQYTAHEFTGRFGIDPIHLRYYENSEHPHLEVRKRISDHCPVWATLAESTDVQPRTHVPRRRWNVRLCPQLVRRGIELRK